MNIEKDLDLDEKVKQQQSETVFQAVETSEKSPVLQTTNVVSAPLPPRHTVSTVKDAYKLNSLSMALLNLGN